jgi:hypothetical protein
VAINPNVTTLIIIQIDLAVILYFSSVVPHAAAVIS